MKKEEWLIYQPVEQSFFERPVLEIAKDLIGHLIVHERPTGLVIARIVETEAYHGPEDQAAHSFNNRRTKRTAVMFDEPGAVYTYQMHTHTLMNVVCGPVGTPHAVLIRAGEPVEGLDFMREQRGEHLAMKDWTNGPGKLTKALGITMDYYGHHWTNSPLYIAEAAAVGEIAVSPRVGISNAGDAVSYPWRFYEKDNAFVSKFRP